MVLIRYWVLDLGPQTYEGVNCIYPPCYQYAVVSDNLEASLFVLARDVDYYNANYDAKLLATLKSQGFTRIYNKPIQTYQKKDCVYVEK